MKPNFNQRARWLNLLLVFSLLANLLLPVASVKAANPGPARFISPGLISQKLKNPGVAKEAQRAQSQTFSPPQAGAMAIAATVLVTRCVAYTQTYWYPVGNNYCDPAVSNCAEGDGEPDTVPAGPGMSYHQVEFFPQRVRANTDVGYYWQSAQGGYATRYVDVKLDGQWVRLETQDYSLSGVWRWDGRSLGGYAGQYLSGIRFGFYSGYQFVIDGYRVSNLDCIESPLDLTPDQSLSPNECPFCGNEERQNFAGKPINTFSGNYNYEATDLSITTPGQPLRFERTYNSLPLTGTVVYSRPLGYGWTHNYDLNLTFEPGLVTLKAPHGSRLRFEDNNGSYTAYAGVWATLTRTLTVPYIYIVTAFNQETFVFNDTGRLTVQLDPKGNRTDLTRADGITLTRVSDAASGRYLDFGYDAQGRLTSVSDHTGRTAWYGYDTLDNLTIVTDTRGLTWTYVYTSASLSAGSGHYLHAVLDPDGKIVEKTFFDSQGRAVRQENGAGNPLVTIEYKPGNTRVITEAGRIFTDTYDSRNLLVGQTDALGQAQNFTFDAFFNRAGLLDARRNPITYTRTPMGLTAAITDALQNSTRFGYDGRNNLTTVSDARQNTTTYTYDGQNNLKTATTVSGTTVYTYNSLGQITALRDANGQITQYGYDPGGNLTQIINPKAESVNLEYDTLGRVITVTTPAQANVKTVYQYDNGDHLTLLTQNYRADSCPPTECNLITQYGYDGAGRLTNLTDPKNRTTRYEYDPAGRPQRVIQNYQNGVHETGEATDADVITAYEYDSYGRLWRLTDPLGYKTRYEYDALNRVSRVVFNADGSGPSVNNSYGYDAVGNLTVMTNTVGQTTTFTYDALNRLTQTQNPQSTLQNQYDAVGNLTQLTDANAIKTRYSYDSLNRLTAVIENYVNNAPATPDQNVTTVYRYDPIGNLTQIVNPKSAAVTLQYDALNRLTALTDPLTRTTRYSYDPAGNRAVITDANLQVTSLSYDPLHRLSSVNYPGSTPDVSLSYDQTGNPTAMTDGTGTITYTYDALNQLTAVKDGTGQMVNYAYDLNGNRTRLTYPTNQSVVYGYDGLNRLQTVTDWTSGRYTTTYDTAGRLADLTRPNGVKTVYGYDTAGRLITLTHQAALTTTLSRYAYTLDTVGNHRQVVETIPVCAKQYYLPIIFKSGSGLSSPTAPTIPPDGPFNSPLAAPSGVASTPSQPALTDFVARFLAYLPLIFGGSPEASPTTTLQPAAVQTASLPASCRLMTITRTLVYTYDNLYRLTDARYSTGENYRYTYDAAGNRLTQTTLSGTTVYTYDAANRLTNVNGQAYTWDNNGNLLNDGVRAYNYDAANRLITVTQGATTTQFLYNGNGDRTSLTVNGVASTYALDPVGLAQVLAETTGGQTRQYLPGLAQYEAGAWAYQLPDSLGSVRQVVNSSRQVTLFQNYDPFGNPAQVVGSPSGVFGYTGEQVDPTDLIYLRARYYSPATGRFLTPDPFHGFPMLPGTLHPYNYALNNPILYTDPSGKIPPLIIVAVGLVLVGTMLTLNADTPLPPDQVPPPEQGLFGMGLIFTGGGLAFPRLLAGAGTAIEAACADGECTNEINTGTNVVYRVVENGVTRYVGITNDFFRRAGEHWRTNGWRIQPIRGLGNLSRFDARAVEQVLIEHYGLANLCNQINSIATTNYPVYQDAIQRGTEILRQTGFLQ